MLDELLVDEGGDVAFDALGRDAGGLGEAIGADIKFGWPDSFIPHGSQTELESRFGLDAVSIAEKIRSVYG